MTLDEFLFPLKKHSIRELCLGALYYHQRVGTGSALPADELRTLLAKSGIPRVRSSNIAAILSRASPYVARSGKDGRKILWRITDTGSIWVRDNCDLPVQVATAEGDLQSLRLLVDSLANDDVTDYLNEAIKCLEAKAYRATVVFVWSAAVRKFRDDVFACGPRVTAAVQRFDKTSKQISKLDDLVLIKESTLLLAMQELGLVDKNQRTILESSLDLRNKCGHPGKYKPGEKKVSSFIEDLIGIAFR